MSIDHSHGHGYEEPAHLNRPVELGTFTVDRALYEGMITQAVNPESRITSVLDGDQRYGVHFAGSLVMPTLVEGRLPSIIGELRIGYPDHQTGIVHWESQPALAEASGPSRVRKVLHSLGFPVSDAVAIRVTSTVEENHTA